MALNHLFIFSWMSVLVTPLPKMLTNTSSTTPSNITSTITTDVPSMISFNISSMTPPDVNSMTPPDVNTVTPPDESSVAPPDESSVTSPDVSSVTPLDKSSVIPLDESSVTPPDERSVTATDVRSTTPSNTLIEMDPHIDEDTPWTVIKDACIKGNNFKTFDEVVTITDCKRLCIRELGEQCRSIDYEVNTLMCHISEAGSDSDDYTEPCYDGIVTKFTERLQEEDCAINTSISGDCVHIDNHEFIFSDEALSWSNAVNACSSIGRLAVLNDRILAEAVRDYANIHYERAVFWAGGSDILKEGFFTWIDGTPFASNFPWKNGEPNNYNNDEDCLQLNYIFSEVFREGYYDEGCSQRRRYICEIYEGTTCPYPFEDVGGCCYFFSSGQDIKNSTTTWQEADNICQELGTQVGRTSYLAEVGTVSHCNDVKFMDEVAVRGDHEYWFGAKDIVENDWRWQPNGQPFSLHSNMWASWEPNGGTRENCLVAWVGQYNGHVDRAFFADVPCDRDESHYICQLF